MSDDKALQKFTMSVFVQQHGDKSDVACNSF